MDKRVIFAGIVFLLIGSVFLGFSMASSSTVIALDSSTRQIPGVAQLVNGRLDITVVVVTPSWSMDLINTNTAASIVGQTVPVGTDISFKGRLIGTDGQPIPNYWVTVNLLAQGKVAESGDQCWLGSSKTDANGYFGSGYYVEVKADGWWSNYPGVDGAYIQTKNGAGNPGCQTWATQNPSSKTYSGYAAVSSTYYSSAPSFTVASAPPACAVTGDVYVNGVTVSPSQSVRTPPQITWAFVTALTSTGISKVTVSWTGSATGSVDLATVSGQPVGSSKWAGTTTLAQGTYTVKMVVTCTAGGTNPVLSLDATVQPGGTEIIDTLQQMRDNLFWISIPFFAIGIVAVSYGAYRKP